MQVANIVSTSNVSVSDDFNVVSSMDNIIHGLPTLIIGIELVIKLYPNFNILDICIEPDIYWTFKRTEKRDKYEEDLNWFIRKVYNDHMKDIVYVFIDPIQHKNNTLRKIIRKIYGLKNIVTYVHNDMVYLYSDKLIFGVDMELLRYVGLNDSKIKNKIKQISEVFLDDKKILIEYKKTVDILGHQVKYIPYLFTVRNGKNNTSSLVHLP